MKNHLHSFIIVILLLSAIKAQSQDTKIGHFFKIKPAVIHTFQECDLAGNTPAGYNPKLIPATSKFTIVNKTATGEYIVRFWSWRFITNVAPTALQIANIVPAYIAPGLTTAAGLSSASDQDKAESYNYVVINGAWDFRYFKLTEAELELYAVELQSRWLATAGTATMPFKWRHTGGEDFSKDLAISNLGGVKYKINDNWSVSALLGLGISSVKLDSANTKGTIKENSDFAAFTISTGVVIEFKRLQFGVFTGWDNLSTSSRNNWIYQGRNWLGFGIGFSLYSESEAPSAEKSN